MDSYDVFGDPKEQPVAKHGGGFIIHWREEWTNLPAKIISHLPVENLNLKKNRPLKWQKTQEI